MDGGAWALSWVVGPVGTTAPAQWCGKRAGKVMKSA
jgi:hypothetical protein